MDMENVCLLPAGKPVFRLLILRIRLIGRNPAPVFAIWQEGGDRRSVS